MFGLRKVFCISGLRDTMKWQFKRQQQRQQQKRQQPRQRQRQQKQQHRQRQRQQQGQQPKTRHKQFSNNLHLTLVLGRLREKPEEHEACDVDICLLPENIYKYFTNAYFHLKCDPISIIVTSSSSSSSSFQNFRSHHLV